MRFQLNPLASNGVSVVPEQPLNRARGAVLAGKDGKVQSIVAGTNVTVNNTDPNNPIISSSGSGGSIPSATFTTQGKVLQQLYNVRDYGALGDGSTNDAVSIQSALNAAQTAGGGIVFFSEGTYVVSSTSRKDTVSYTSGTTINDVSAISGDIGSYLVGAGIQGRIPKITAVSVGVSFTVDITPQGTPTSLYVVKPGFVLPEGVQIVGAGATFTTNGFGTGNASSSAIFDNGSGITCLVRGASASGGNASSRYGLKDISITGNANSTLYGIYVSNMAWYLTIDNCDISQHGTAGLVLDGNMNSNDIRNTIFSYNGTVGANGYTGGVITTPFWQQPSAAVNFYNCFFDANFGWGIANGSGGGAFGVNLLNCQFNNTQATAATNSGTSMMLSTVTMGSANVSGGWSESAALYDMYSAGPIVVTGFQFKSASTYHWYINGGSASVIGCWFSNAATASLMIGSGGNVTWNTTYIEDPYFFSGCPPNSAILGMGSTYTISGAGTGMSPGGFGQSTSNQIWQGSGAPSNSNGSNGDYYFRTDGSPGTQIYTKSSGSWNPIGTGISRNIISISTATNAGTTINTDYTYIVTGITTLTLPSAIGNTNRYSVVSTDGQTTVATTSTQTINGSSTATLPITNMSLDFVSDNANWHIE